MSEIQAIAMAYSEARLRNELCALATIVSVKGSSYRKPGARMLILADGSIVGSVSGGCLEGDVIERAHRVIRTGEPELTTYDTTGDDDILFGLGMGCRGIVDVLIEPLEGRAGAVLTRIVECIEQSASVAVATVYRSQGSCPLNAGDRAVLQDGGGSASFDFSVDVDPDLFVTALERALDSNKTTSECIDMAQGSVDVLLEVLRPPMPLVIFGAGNDAQPLARLAKAIGWRVSVVDGRPAYATADRFREADRVVVANIDDLTDCLGLDARSAAVVMTHNYLRDAAVVEALLESAVGYIGILGSRSRIDEMLRDLAHRNIYDPAIHAERVHGPVGLDIGADTPDTIALAIISEIQAAMTGHSGGYLRDSIPAAIPAAASQEDTDIKAQFKCALSAG